jgi:hypothetical protein
LADELTRNTLVAIRAGTKAVSEIEYVHKHVALRRCWKLGAVFDHFLTWKELTLCGQCPKSRLRRTPAMTGASPGFFMSRAVPV